MQVQRSRRRLVRPKMALGQIPPGPGRLLPRPPPDSTSLLHSSPRRRLFDKRVFLLGKQDMPCVRLFLSATYDFQCVYLHGGGDHEVTLDGKYNLQR